MRQRVYGVRDYDGAVHQEREEIGRGGERGERIGRSRSREREERALSTMGFNIGRGRERERGGGTDGHGGGHGSGSNKMNSNSSYIRNGSDNNSTKNHTIKNDVIIDNNTANNSSSSSNRSSKAGISRKRGWDDQVSSPPGSGEVGSRERGRARDSPPSKKSMKRGKNIVNPQQHELLLLIVRATYCAHFPRLAAGLQALPPFLPYPLDVSAGLPPKSDPLAQELSKATRSAVVERGFREMLAGVEESVLRVEEEGGREGGPPQVHVSVSTALLIKLRKILFLKIKKDRIEMKNALEKNVIESVFRSVRTAGTSLGGNKTDYAPVLLNTPWDVIGYCRKSILTRLILLGEAVMQHPEEWTKRLQLTVLIQRLAQPNNGVWEKEIKDIQRLANRLNKLQPPLNLPNTSPTNAASTFSSSSSSSRSCFSPPPDSLPLPSPPSMLMDEGQGGGKGVSGKVGRNVYHLASPMADSSMLHSPVVSPPHSPSRRSKRVTAQTAVQAADTAAVADAAMVTDEKGGGDSWGLDTASAAGAPHSSFMNVASSPSSSYLSSSFASAAAAVAADATTVLSTHSTLPSIHPSSSAAAAAPRDPRKLAKEKAARRKKNFKKVDFVLPTEEEIGAHYQHTTYLRSHAFEEAYGVPGTTVQVSKCIHCQVQTWTHRCSKCGRCHGCASVIFCKGAERQCNVSDKGHVNRLSERMDRAIWDAFKDNKKGFEPILALVEHAGVSVNFQRPAKGETALMAAAFQGNLTVLKELLALGADPSLTTGDKHTAWTFATKFNHKECAEVLATHAAMAVVASGGGGGGRKERDFV